MSTGASHQIAICIDQKLSGPLEISEWQSIFKVHGKLRSESEEAYEPQVVSIGPYHHNKSELKTMEKHKLRYLRELLERTGESSTENYIIALAKHLDRARMYYAEEINLRDANFLEMLCLDGCFVIEFLRKLQHPTWLKENDPIFQMPWLILATQRDLILFENQLPFFVVSKLFDMTKITGTEENLIDLAIKHLICPLSDSFFQPQVNSSTIFANGKVFHLLDIMHKSWSHSFSEAQSKDFKPEDTTSTLQFIKSASGLLEKGINFKMLKESKSLFDNTFENGVVEIPPLTVDDFTDSIFRNLIAYEEYMPESHVTGKYIGAYISFMDNLIDSPSDVEVLRHRHIIENLLGNDKAVSTMFNKLRNEVTIGSLFGYGKIIAGVNEYSNKRRHTWWAHLMGNYFNTPWSIISFLAAFVLILLTIVQTVFSIVQYTSAQPN